MERNSERAKNLALEILRAYHLEIKSGFVSDASAVERERAQQAAFDVAEKFVTDTFSRHIDMVQKFGDKNGISTGEICYEIWSCK